MRRSHVAQVWLTIVAAAVLMIVPVPESVAFARPHLVAMVVIYWRLEAPEDLGLGTAFAAGLLLDLLVGEALGLSSLGLVIIAYIVGRFRLRIRFFPLWQQAVMVFGVLLNDRVIAVWINAIAGRELPGWSFVAAPLVAMAIWPWLFLGLDEIRRRGRQR